MTEYKGIPVTVENAHKPESVEDFVRRLGLKIVVHCRDSENYKFTGYRYYADFGNRVGSIRDRMEGGIFGDGNTIEQAVASLLDNMRSRVVRLKIYSEDCSTARYIDCPQFL